MDYLTMIWKEAVWTKNALLAPITVGIVVAVISAISTWFIKKYLKAQDAGNMWVYSSFAVINKAAGDSLVVTWTLTVS